MIEKNGKVTTLPSTGSIVSMDSMERSLSAGFTCQAAETEEYKAIYRMHVTGRCSSELWTRAIQAETISTRKSVLAEAVRNIWYCVDVGMHDSMKEAREHVLGMLREATTPTMD